MNIVLASGSPRRQELLKMTGIENFKVLPYTHEEMIPADPDPDPERTVRKIALEKAIGVSQECEPDDIIISADTLVYLDGSPLGKPNDPDDAAEMLRKLSGRKHTVYTGVAVLNNGKQTTFAEKTDVFFRNISDVELSSYIETGEPADKAGAYGAQGRGAVFIERIEGDFFNVMGLPVCRLIMTLKELGLTC